MCGYDDDFDCDVNDDDGQSQFDTVVASYELYRIKSTKMALMKTMLTKMTTFQYLPHMP